MSMEFRIFYRHQNCSFPSIIENCYREAICDLFSKFLILCCLKTSVLVIIFFSKVQIQHRSSCGLRGRLEGLHYI